MTVLRVLDTSLLVTDYAALAEQARQWAQLPGARAVEFANTHIVAMSRHDPAFRRLIGACDYLIPDGMPLVWCLNRMGAGLQDRVYGPTFMRQFMETVSESTHYLIGGSEACGELLRKRFGACNPQARIVGAFHGRCSADGRLEGAAGEEVMEELERLKPDYIWVGLGTPKQQAWVSRHKHLLARGVIFGVGFAFDANAGLKPDAPQWMQRSGLTWLYRLCSEPARLGPRYLKYNSLFLWYLLRHGLRRAG